MEKKVFLILFWSWTRCENQADLSSSSVLVLTIFSLETWAQWHVTSIWIKSPVQQTTAVSSVQDPNKVLVTAPDCGTNSFHEVCTHPSCRTGSPSHTGHRQELGQAVLTQEHSPGVNGPCLHQLLLKHGGGSFSRSLMGDVSISSNWAVLQTKMLLENQSPFVRSSSLSPLSPQSRHGAELQALQHLDDG